MSDAGTVEMAALTVPDAEWRGLLNAVNALTEERGALMLALAEVKERLNGLLSPRPVVDVAALPEGDRAKLEKAKKTLAVVETGRARGYFSCREFAAAIGRDRHWVSDACKRRVIRPMSGRMPWRIPYVEYERVMKNERWR